MTETPEARPEGVSASKGHVWAPCSICGRGTLIAKNRIRKTKKNPAGTPPCRMTPRCEGRHTPEGFPLGQLALTDNGGLREEPYT